MLPLYQRLEAVILFMVKVPVLSEQIQLVEPKVSTESKFLQRTFFSESLLAVRASPTVTSTIIPSGTFAVTIPIANIKFKIAEYPTANPNPKRRTPILTANIVSLIINLFISFFNGASYC